MDNTILTGKAVQDIIAVLQKAGLNNWEMLVPEGVEEIAPGAFTGLRNIRQVQLPKTLRKIGAIAFYGCENLTHITLPSGLVEIDTAAFKESGLQEIVIPPKVSKLGSEVFANTALRQTEIKGQHIGAAMFRGCSRLSKVQMNNNIRRIEDGAFRECITLKTLRLPDKLREIGKETFWGCESLERLSLPQTVCDIGESAFYGCAFETVHVPQNIKRIRYETFSECKKLRTIYFPDGVEHIESDAFYGCENLKTVYFGADFRKVQKIQIGEENTPLIEASLHCGVEDKTKVGG